MLLLQMNFSTTREEKSKTGQKHTNNTFNVFVSCVIDGTVTKPVLFLFLSKQNWTDINEIKSNKPIMEHSLVAVSRITPRFFMGNKSSFKHKSTNIQINLIKMQV